MSICACLLHSTCPCCCPKEDSLITSSEEDSVAHCYQNTGNVTTEEEENNVEPSITRTITRAVPSAIVDGESLRGTSIDRISAGINTIRNVSIQITNYTDTYTLLNPRVSTSSGHCLNPPQPTIAKKTSEVCSFTKTSSTARGSVGVLVYEILSDEGESVGELAIMFSVPFNYNHYENYFGLGIFEQSISCDYGLFARMYYDNGPFVATVAKGSEIKYCGKGMCVKGTMSPMGNAIMKVEFRELDSGSSQTE